MFTWNFAKSAEAVFSRWAVKRLFKFLLKKKLGQFLLGDIDIDQLDIQLRQGTIQLTDLALNVDYLNDKFGAATLVIIKEGSIGSLSVKMPWNGKGFQVEVDELEIVLAFSPFMRKKSQEGNDNSSSHEYNNFHKQNEGQNCVNDTMDNAAKSSSNDVHEGVKTIAKMVKWFLTSFHVNVKKLIVAFEPNSEDEKKLGHQKTFVLRVSDVECGTCVSEDADSYSDANVESFLGISQLTNFITFQGAVIELLQIDGVEDQNCFSPLTGSNFCELLSGNWSSKATTPIATGSKGGFSGNLKFSIPWKNGSLDIRKVDASISVEPVKLKFQPSSIKWLLLSWETYQTLDKERHSRSTDGVGLNTDSQFYSSACIPTGAASDKVIPGHGEFFSTFAYPTDRESAIEDMLPGSHLIPDWIPNSSKGSYQIGSQEELDLGKSVDQFFECFDGMRGSQSALGSSGIWNWTCSVFSVLTAASSLASGSLHIPSEQQHVQTNLRWSLAGICIILSFQDELHDPCYPKDDGSSNGSTAHHLVAECKSIIFSVQVCPREMRFEGKVKHIEVIEYASHGHDVMDLDSESQTLSIHQLQEDVQDSLPSWVQSATDPESGKIYQQNSSDFVFRNMIKIKLLSTSGVTCCQFSVNSDSSDRSGPTLFSLQLPHFIFWVNFWSIRMLLNLLRDIQESVKIDSQKSRCAAVNQQDGASLLIVKKDSCKGVGKLSTAEYLKVNISILNARVIICFPFGTGKGTGAFFSWDQFIAVDFSTPSTLGKENVQDTRFASDASSWKRYVSKATRTVQLNVGSLNIYLVNPTCERDNGIKLHDVLRRTYCAQKILSVSNASGCLSTIAMVWQEDSATGPWVVERARSLVTPEQSRDAKRTTVKGCEFASVTSMRDLEDKNSQTQEELILSSSFFVHIHMFPVVIDLGVSQYGDFHHLLDQMIRGFSVCGGETLYASQISETVMEASTDSVKSGQILSFSQTSFVVECTSVDILIRPHIKEDVKNSLQNELPGSWNFFRLRVKKFDILSVSNIGNDVDASFLWLSHGEGKLWGSVTGVPNHEFLLISCNNCTRKRGNGTGSNALSSRLAGSNILHLRDPRNFHEFTSIMVRCGTIVAVGGRLDWLDVISSFFSFSSHEVEKVADKLPKTNLGTPFATTFVLKLIDIGLSYEPHLKNLNSGLSSCFREEISKRHFGCLLAASSLTLLNTTTEDPVDTDYKIVMQDLGFLLCEAYQNHGGSYSVEYLHEMGYVKVAHEAHIETVLRINCNNGLPWVLECSESHIHLETCYDTTAGLIQLAAQLQQLYAPDLEESVVHLQTRWNNVHQAQESNEVNDGNRTFDDTYASSMSQVHASSIDRNRKLGIVGLMDEIHEDAFHLNGNQDGQFNSNESQVHVSLDEGFLGAEIVSESLSFEGSMPPIVLENNQTSYLQNDSLPELIEGYCLSELRPLSELSIGRQSPSECVIFRSRNSEDGDIGIGKNGWYKDVPLTIFENHITEAGGEASLNHASEDNVSPFDCSRADDFGKAIGRLLLKNINVSWRMFAGSDWYAHEKSVGESSSINGRNTSTCLELVLSRMQFQYDIFPAVGICASKLSVSAQDFYFYDRSISAPWTRVLGYYRSKDRPRESYSKALKLELEAVRPDPLTPLEEYRLHIALLPMLLQLHQSQLDFLIGFFGPKDSPAEASDLNHNSNAAKSSATKNLAGQRIAEEALLPYFQKFDIWPIVLRVDYSPHCVDLAALGSGKYVELVNLVPWKGVELQLKHVHSVGVYGWANVCETIIGEWLEDISQNQIHKVLRGLPTIRSLVAVGAGAAKLVSSPVVSYRKDQRVLKGMQRGTIAFLRSISLEAVALGVHLAAGVHDILLQAEYILTKIPPSVAWSVEGKTKPNVRCNQPKNAQHGIQQAYESLSDGLGKSASALVQRPLKKLQRGASAGSALATAVKGVPAAAIAPVSACASAAHYALLGLRNSLDPEHKKESMDKYLGPTHQSDLD